MAPLFPFHYLLKAVHRLRNKTVSAPAPSSAEAQSTEAAGQIASQRHPLTCKCGWQGSGAESKKAYKLLSEQVVEVKLYCRACKQYLGYILYKEAL